MTNPQNKAVAMMTTVVGLIVAIIAFSIYKMFDRHIDRKSRFLTDIVSELNIRYGKELSNINLQHNPGLDGGIDESI